VATSGASIRILRNLGIEKRLLLLPTRRLQNIAGPLDVNMTSSAINKVGINKKANAIKHKNKSKMRFFKGYYLINRQYLKEKSFF
jgi:hypothetical protein